MVTLHRCRLESPVGSLLLAARGESLSLLAFAGREAADLRALEARFPACTFVEAKDPAGAVARLERYFKGDLAALDGIDVDTGGSDFQRRVWAALRTIPAGRTWSYAALARRVGQPTAVRAVAAANARNPVAIVIPCHRVIGSDGSLTGYGGGLARKQWLLSHEGVAVPRQARLFT